ncbi:MAG TPA: hypothetical protein VIG72_08155 [Pontibacter sp.]
MRIKAFCLLLFLVLATIVATPQVLAQECSGYYLLTNSAEYELINYDRKDRLAGRVYYKVTSVNSSPTKTEAIIHSRILDDKGNLTTESDYTVSCKDGSMLVDMRSMVNADLLAAYRNMEVKTQGDQLDYPATLTTGQELKDATFTIDVLDKETQQPLTTIVMHVTGRTVGEKENIHVPAGAYTAFKINQELEIRTETMSTNVPPARIRTVEYFVPGLGMVRSEAYKNGKLISYSVLNKVTKPEH